MVTISHHFIDYKGGIKTDKTTMQQLKDIEEHIKRQERIIEKFKKDRDKAYYEGYKQGRFDEKMSLVE